MTVGELKKYIAGFPDDTKIVVGNSANDSVEECHINTYYPPHLEETFWLVIDTNLN